METPDFLAKLPGLSILPGVSASRARFGKNELDMVISNSIQNHQARFANIFRLIRCLLTFCQKSKGHRLISLFLSFRELSTWRDKPIELMYLPVSGCIEMELRHPATMRDGPWFPSTLQARLLKPFWPKAISSKTECENLVYPPLDGLIRWESVERRTRKM